MRIDIMKDAMTTGRCFLKNIVEKFVEFSQCFFVQHYKDHEACEYSSCQETGGQLQMGFYLLGHLVLSLVNSFQLMFWLSLDPYINLLV